MTHSRGRPREAEARNAITALFVVLFVVLLLFQDVLALVLSTDTEISYGSQKGPNLRGV